MKPEEHAEWVEKYPEGEDRVAAENRQRLEELAKKPAKPEKENGK